MFSETVPVPEDVCHLSLSGNSPAHGKPTPGPSQCRFTVTINTSFLREGMDSGPHLTTWEGSWCSLRVGLTHSHPARVNLAVTPRSPGGSGDSINTCHLRVCIPPQSELRVQTPSPSSARTGGWVNEALNGRHSAPTPASCRASGRGTLCAVKSGDSPRLRSSGYGLASSFQAPPPWGLAQSLGPVRGRSGRGTGSGAPCSLCHTTLSESHSTLPSPTPRLTQSVARDLTISCHSGPYPTPH